ncbi:NAD(P)-binding domain-containing protein [Nocardia sp. CNY236]|uniref:NAD(P)-binding domain-containing protein n=1 Tax=Nocardia sp. CNY236 TaxID=1169152 RepID=UPI000401351D|nr:NAD(P)-binding domain-containing protein [Nocardia sp. CNY236]
MAAGTRIAVIGAGPSGIAAAKECIAHGLGADLVVFEKSDQVGGNWVFREDPGHSSIYWTTHTISSKYYSEYEDFALPPDTPDYPHHTQLKKYFQDYAQHFDVIPRIRFHTEVLHATRREDGAWLIRSCGPGGEQVEVFDVLMVANGHHWNPRMPEYPGRFDGEFIHSHAFKSNVPFTGKRVLVIGGGNSGADVAVECSRVAERCDISMRHGLWIVPKFIVGWPNDVVSDKTAGMLPYSVRQPVMETVVHLTIGRYEHFGLQRPEHGVLQCHPTINSELIYSLGHGDVVPRVGVSRFDGDRVHFEDGSSEVFDAVIAATGYKITFPFFDTSFIDWEEAKKVPLWRRMFHADVPNLYFIGLFQPLGSVWPLADYQAMLACLEITGRYHRPPDMRRAIAHELAHPHFKFIDSVRHSTEVGYGDFRRELLTELKKAGARPHLRPENASIRLAKAWGTRRLGAPARRDRKAWRREDARRRQAQTRSAAANGSGGSVDGAGAQ